MHPILLILSAALAVGPVQTREERAVASHLVQYGASAPRAREVSRHIVAQAARHDVSPALVAALVSVENPALRPTATSSAGARGLMQVMPFWTQTAYGARCGRNLRDDVTNLCLGIHVLQHQLTARRSLRGALLAYNGCPSSTAPCGRYARIVLARYQTLTARIERDVLDLTVHGTWGAPWTARPLLPLTCDTTHDKDRLPSV